MADEDEVKISELPAASSVTGEELVPLVQGGTTKQAALSLFASLFGTPGAVLFNEEQTLEASDQIQALRNLGLAHDGIMVIRDPAFGRFHDHNWVRFFKKTVGTGDLDRPVYTETGADLDSNYTGKAVVPTLNGGFHYQYMVDYISGTRVAGSGWFVSTSDDAPEADWAAGNSWGFEGYESYGVRSVPAVTRVTAIIPDLALYNAAAKHPVLFNPSVQTGFSQAAIPFVDQTIYFNPISGGVPGTIATGAFQLPPVAGARYGQVIHLCSAGYAVTTFTLTVSGGGTISGTTPTTLAANTFYSFQCVNIGANVTWLRLP